MKEKRFQHLTVRNGGFLARFGDFNAFNGKNATTTTLGWGGYYFVVPPGPDDAGGVSDYILNPQESVGAGEGQSSAGVGRPPNEWGRTLRLGDRTVDVTIRLKKGIVVEGHVLDQAGQPVTPTTVTLHQDLGADTHTGYGGEIFERAIMTDPRGCYRFTKVYPATLHLSTIAGRHPKGSGNPTHWLRTRLGAQGAWQDDRIDEISVKPVQNLIQVDIGLVPEGQFVYRGTVTDASGAPIPNATIVLGCSDHKSPGSYTDMHHFEHAHTSNSGQYELRIDTPWVRFIRAEKDSYKPFSYESENNEGPSGVRLDPGRYDFKLEKSTPAQGNK